MKAWHVHSGDPHDSSLLVLAATRNRARYKAFKHGTWEYDEYVYTHAVRVPQFDGASEAEMVCDTNEDIPVGFPKFYTDWEE